MKILIGIILAMLLAGVGYSQYQKAEQEKHRAEIRESLSEVRGFFRRIDDANKLAASTSRVALSGPVKDLQQIGRDIKAFKAKGCAAEPAALAEEAVRLISEAYMEFMRNGTQERIDHLFREAALKVEENARALHACEATLK